MPTKQQLIKWMDKNGWGYWYHTCCAKIQTDADLTDVIHKLSFVSEIPVELLKSQIKDTTV